MYKTPGVYRETVLPVPAARLWTGVPAFLGITADQDGLGQPILPNQPYRLTRWPQFEQQLGTPLVPPQGYLAEAVRGFFANGGDLCYVVPLAKDVNALAAGLNAITPLTDVDLVCAPDIMLQPPDRRLTQQRQVLDYCERLGDRFAILDALPAPNLAEPFPLTLTRLREQRQALQSTQGALYFPWIDVGRQDEHTGERHYIPPCGHVAGCYAHSDRQTGVHKAPANVALEGVLGLSKAISTVQQATLNADQDTSGSINCLRILPGRGIRVWGARTLSPDPTWAYINVRRLVITIGRWIETHLATLLFEPNTPALWAAIRRELQVYLMGLLQQGALQGNSPSEAFYVKCDAETNSPAVQTTGAVVTELGVAPTVPSEFVVVRIIQAVSGTSVAIAPP